jgi:hypothetical protein
MTILTSLLIATQGLLPTPTPLEIGTQGLLTAGGAPPPPAIVAKDLPGGFTSRPVRKVEVRGVSAKLSTDGARVRVSTSVLATGNRASIGAIAPSQHISASVCSQSNISNVSSNRAWLRVSTSFEVIGCEEDDEAAIRLLAQAALEEFYLQNITGAYDD